jgi:hypothetical protein
MGEEVSGIQISKLMKAKLMNNLKTGYMMRPL